MSKDADSWIARPAASSQTEWEQARTDSLSSPLSFEDVENEMTDTSDSFSSSLLFADSENTSFENVNLFESSASQTIDFSNVEHAFDEFASNTFIDEPVEKTSEESPHLSHVDARGQARMVDVSAKADTVREAIACGFISMQKNTLDMIVEGRAAKGDVLATARIAAIMGAKQTSSLIPMCHPLNITKVAVELKTVGPYDRDDGRVGIAVEAVCGVTGKTGIEMEALTAVSIACLTIYDMCKAVDRWMEISDIHLVRKSGGKSGLWERED